MKLIKVKCGDVGRLPSDVLSWLKKNQNRTWPNSKAFERDFERETDYEVLGVFSSHTNCIDPDGNDGYDDEFSIPVKNYDGKVRVEDGSGFSLDKEKDAVKDVKPKQLPADTQTINQMKRRVLGYAAKASSLSNEILRYLEGQTNAETVGFDVSKDIVAIVSALEKISQKAGK